MSDIAAVAEVVEDACGSGSPYNGRLGLRVAAIFVILVTSAFGTLFPIVCRRVERLRVHEGIYAFAKYFGSGVIIATAFIHLLAPAFEYLGSPCLTGAWTDYSWAPALSMSAVFAIFIVELVAHRAGASYLKKRGLSGVDHHKQGGADITHSSHGLHVSDPSAERLADTETGLGKTAESSEQEHEHEHGAEMIDETAMAQILGVAILEFGVIFHSFIIGLTLAVNDDFVTLFVVLIFHQMFEGLGLGARLSTLPLPSRLNWVPFVGAIVYACITPLGIAIGLGVRETYNPDSAAAVIVAGVLDSLSSGILLYTGLVELLAHDFIFNKEMATEASNGKVAYSVGCVVLGAGLMALLGRWA